VDVTVM